MSRLSKTTLILSGSLGVTWVLIVGVFYSGNFSHVQHTISIGSLYQAKENSRKHVSSASIVGWSFSEKKFSNYLPDFYSSFEPLENSTWDNFRQASLIKSPTETDVLSKHLKSADEVIREAQRIHFNLFSDIFKGYKYAMLMDLATYENKGDPAIAAGEVFLLRRLGIKLLYYCNTYACSDRNLDFAKKIADGYSGDELVILLGGGGNLVAYETNDYLRERVFKRFKKFPKILFPQSVLVRDKNSHHFDFCKRLYSNEEKFTMILRDRQSLEYAQDYFKGTTRLMMVPDMAFQIGRVARFIPPSFDILWIRRQDSESPGYKLPPLPPGITIKVADWWAWKTPRGQTSMETAFLMANNGLIFLQRGRVVITDRLHGHILSTLLDIPHVLIDNKARKLSSYHHTWTNGVANIVLAENASHAVDVALQLLEVYKDELPPIASYMDVKEMP